MAPLKVSLRRRGRTSAHLEFAAAPDALLGARAVRLESAAFGGKLLIPLDLPVNLRASVPPQRESCQMLESLSAPWAQENQTWSNWGIIDSPQTFFGFLPTPKLFGRQIPTRSRRP
jgi:hypothetical protein